MRVMTGLPARNQRDETAISTTVTMDTTVTEPEVPTFAEAAKVWARIGLLSFGGPAGQIALIHRTSGGLVAGILFVLPGALVMLGLSVLYVLYREVPLIDAVFFGIKAAVLAVVVEAVLRIGKRALSRTEQGIARSVARKHRSRAAIPLLHA